MISTLIQLFNEDYNKRQQNMKTIKERLETLPEPYRTQALANVHHDSLLEVKYDTLRAAIGGAFLWEESPQEQAYWKTLCDGEALPYVGQTEPPTNALSALHAIALKKGFPVEDITGIWQSKSDADVWSYKIVNGFEDEYLINLKTE